MNILKALILTLAPAIIGLSSTYLTIAEYPLDALLKIIALQLWFVEPRWLLISFIFNYYLVSKISKLEAANLKTARGEAELQGS